MHRGLAGQGEAAIGIVARIEANEMGGHNVLTRGGLRLLITDPEGTGDSGGANLPRHLVVEIDRNLPPPHRHEILAHRDAPTPRKLRRHVYPAMKLR